MNTKDALYQHGKVLGHPSGLFVLFFTEMWERFSFYGMRVLLVNFLTMTLIGYNPGWEWSAENATALFGTYAMMLYVTPIIGGIIADRYIGYRLAVVLGALIMTGGHALMALETEFSLYGGLALLVLGTGFFKPNITSIISEMYKSHPEKKDGAYTIFYMGVNSGAFFGMMLCGYLAEKIGWAWGFGLAGVFMLLGTLQFWFATPLFGKIGAKPDPQAVSEPAKEKSQESSDTEKRNPFNIIDWILIAVCSLIGLGYAFNDPMSKIGGIDMFSALSIGEMQGQYVAVLFGLALFIGLVIYRIVRYTPVVRDRMIAFIIFAFFTVFFWMCFEQGASSLVIFARDSVQRELLGNAAIIFKIANAILTVVPLMIITYVLYLLGKQTGKKIGTSNIVLIVCFLGMWGLVGWMLNREFNTTAYNVSYQAEQVQVLDDKGQPKKDDAGNFVYTYNPITTQTEVATLENPVVGREVVIGEAFLELAVGTEIPMIVKDNGGTTFAYLDDKRLAKAYEHGKVNDRDAGVIQATVKEVKDNWVDIPVSWFSILNSFFIIAFASFFSKWWDSKYNPSAAMKYGLGLIIMAVGFGLLAIGAYGLEDGVKVSMVWLILAYLFHTLGELCLSPVGLSYVSKLVPARMIALMFGMWYLAIAIGNKLAALLGGQIESITEEYSLSTFFLIFTITPIVAGILVILAGRPLKKLMHGIH
ncbi:peptide MFS transporter [Pontibacter sp. G13]|uniref:peptide MFS transporter n=1 Tax=Pontibacter sp. G13 TaxID=3074898 RepID=UPI00288A6403|nr:peptide MFS transporter [Pontibacter sp. G13]WNJ21167.1 peptide MFS transporter [Pontibacter sp. G13]